MERVRICQGMVCGGTYKAKKVVRAIIVPESWFLFGKYKGLSSLGALIWFSEHYCVGVQKHRSSNIK